MDVLELRSLPERWLAGRTASAPGRRIVGLHAMAGSVADWLVARRVARRLPPVGDAFVVSVGNLRVGGTGKTPVVAALGAALADRGVPGAVLTRGYGGRAAGPLAVCPDEPLAADEARLLARRLRDRGWMVVQSRDRAAGRAWLGRHAPDRRVILLEDAFQTRGLGRDLDVLILDAWRTADGGVIEPVTGAVLPFGPYRETARGARRAEIWLLETAGPLPEAPPGVTVCGFERRNALAAARGELPTGVPLALVCGLARPERFEAAAASALPGRELSLSVRCRDHADYRPALVRRILEAGRRAGAGGWLTTEKDWVKLASVWPATVPVAVLRQDVVWTWTPTLPDVVEERRREFPGGPDRTRSGAPTPPARR
jgi:tetraacyldisaccharide 4'-kinase